MSSTSPAPAHLMEEEWWFCRRTSSAPEEPGRVSAAANLSKRVWRPACERDILAQSFRGVDLDKLDELPTVQSAKYRSNSRTLPATSSLPPSPFHRATHDSTLLVHKSFSSSSLQDMHGGSRSGGSSQTHSSQASPSGSLKTYRGAPLACLDQGLAATDSDDCDLDFVRQGEDYGSWAGALRLDSMFDAGESSPAPLPGYSRVHFVWSRLDDGGDLLG